MKEDANKQRDEAKRNEIHAILSLNYSVLGGLDCMRFEY